MNDPNDRIRLFQKYDIRPTDAQMKLLDEYADRMIAESDRQNITAVTDKNEIWVRHFLDSAYLLRYLPDDGSRIIDIGTGGGVPGIPLSILTDNEVVLLDSELRKISFCQRVSEALQLRASACCARAEELAKSTDHREKYDFAVSRAMTSGAVLCELAIPYLKIGGRLLGMKGKNYSEEAEGFARAAEKLGAHVSDVVSYDIEGEQKHLIIVEKTAATPTEYPRRYAKIKRSPL